MSEPETREMPESLSACVAENSWVKRAETVIAALRSKGFLP
jgi:hypothetical protein